MMAGQYTVHPSTPLINFGHHKKVILGFYFAFLIIGGNVCLLLLITTALLKKTASRLHPALINFLVSWMVYATACLLLLYSGKQDSSQLDVGICLTQAALMYGSISAGSVATFCLVLQLWLNFKCRNLFGRPRLSLGLLLCTPWAFFLFFVILTVATGATEPSLVTNQWVFYCTVSKTYIVYSISTVGLIMVSLVLVFQVLIHLHLRKLGRIRTLDQSSLRLSLRVTVFTAFSVLFFVVDIVNVFMPTEPATYIIFSILPLIVFLVFGTQKENLHIWFGFWKRSDKRTYMEPMTFRVPSIPQSRNIPSASVYEINKSLPPIRDASNPHGIV